MSVLVLSVAAALLGQEMPLGGTQPQTLMNPPNPSSQCGCHLDYERDRMDEPGQSYAATMMAQAARDPLFQAALVLANRDDPRLTPTCLRCHAPGGWLAGRAEPGDGSSLTPEDMEGITCDVCHRMVAPDEELFIGDGQYTISDSVDKRGSRGVAPSNGHRVQRSDYLKSAEACGVCHSLFNPFLDAHDADGNQLPFPYFEQRTFEEWRDSSVSSNQTCIDCHMKRYDGFNCRERVNRYPDVARHTIVGGNTFGPRAVALLFPELGLNDEVEALRALVAEQLSTAAEIEITSTHDQPTMIVSGEAVQIDVRLTNKTGHKLPTGYPEGRRVFLQVQLDLEGRDTEFVSGEWDPQTGDIIEDDQLRTYETAHGIVGQGRSRHLALANQVMLDTRIPPEGFTPQHADMVPAGRDYGSAPYRHWDDHSYSVTTPAGLTGTVTGTITIRALHQTTSGTYIRFLRDEIGADHPRILDLRRAFAVLGRAPPEPLIEVSLPIVVTERVDPPDAGQIDASTPPAPDASAPVDLGMPVVTTEPGDDCSCSAHRAAGRPSALGLMLLCGLILLRRRRS